jgi:hypothetical protein
MPRKGLRGGSLRDRAKAVKERIKARPGMQKAAAVMKKVRAARAIGEEQSSAKGGRHRKAATKMLLKSGGRGMKC